MSYGGGCLAMYFKINKIWEEGEKRIPQKKSRFISLKADQARALALHYKYYAEAAEGIQKEISKICTTDDVKLEDLQIE